MVQIAQTAPIPSFAMQKYSEDGVLNGVDHQEGISPVLKAQSRSATCTICHDLTIAFGEVLKLNVSSLRQEALKLRHCDTCSMLWECISAIVTDTPHPDIVYDHLLIDYQEHGDMLGRGPLVAHLIPSPIAYGKYSVDLQFYTSFEDPPSPWATIGRGYHIESSGISASSISLVQKWLSSCTAGNGKHANCTTPEVPMLPTRVIYVGDATTAPRLHISLPGERKRYAALSHCWGGNIPTKTKKSNLDDYMVGLPDDLPQTFKDAIVVTRALGLDFVWIDSLCIIQDSIDDWKAESSSMAHVYSNAHVMIAADAADDSSAGFLQAPSRQAPTRCSAQYECSPYGSNQNGDSSRSGLIYVRKRGFLAEELPFHCWGSPGETSGRSKLSTRGWVFQERLLSPRAIHFSTNEIAWECRSLCDCECSATSLRTVRTTSVVKHFLHPRQHDLSAAEASWREEVVPAYTQLDLTMPTDRLPALAGLSQVAQIIRVGDEFLAGLWRKTLAADMLWCVDGYSKESRRQPLEYAPTWSWASVTGAIRYLSLEMETEDYLFLPEDVLFEGSCPTTLVGNCPAVAVTISRPLHGNEREIRVSQTKRMTDITLAVTWDCSHDEQRLPWLDKTNYMFVVFGINKNRNGPFGLLVVLSQNNDTSSGACFNRVGFVDGFKRERRLRRWDSSGWLNEKENEDEERLAGRESSQRDRRDADRMDWMMEVLCMATTQISIC